MYPPSRNVCVCGDVESGFDDEAVFRRHVVHIGVKRNRRRDVGDKLLQLGKRDAVRHIAREKKNSRELFPPGDMFPQGEQLRRKKRR